MGVVYIVLVGVVYHMRESSVICCPFVDGQGEGAQEEDGVWFFDHTLSYQPAGIGGGGGGEAAAMHQYPPGEHDSHGSAPHEEG